MILFLVIGYGDMEFKGLDKPYMEVNRKDEDYWFDETTKVNSLALSEYDQFFRFFDEKPTGIETFGLFHYRCHLDVVDIDSSSVYAASVDFGQTIFSQFKSHHESLLPALDTACRVFLNETGFDALEYLTNNSTWFYRNLFIAPFNFALEWYNLSKLIATKLVKEYGNLEDRWLGYILERLFSAFIVYKVGSKVVSVSETFLGEK